MPLPPPSVYNPNIPQASDKLSVSQGDLLNNMGALEALIDVNHIDFGSVGAGKHFFVEFPVPGSTPVTVANEIGLFSRASPYGTNAYGANSPQLVIQQQSGGLFYEFSSYGSDANGLWTVLPSGMLLKWGQNQISATPNQTFSFSPATVGQGPRFTARPVVIIVPVKITAGVPAPVYLDLTGTNTATQFTVYCTTINTAFIYYAIGAGTGA